MQQSQAIATSSTIYCSGQIPCTPAGEILTQPGASITQMTELCINNLSAVLKAAGSDISKVVKVNVFLTSMDNFAEMNATVRSTSTLHLSRPTYPFPPSRISKKEELWWRFSNLCFGFVIV